MTSPSIVTQPDTADDRHNKNNVFLFMYINMDNPCTGAGLFWFTPNQNKSSDGSSLSEVVHGLHVDERSENRLGRPIGPSLDGFGPFVSNKISASQRASVYLDQVNLPDRKVLLELARDVWKKNAHLTSAEWLRAVFWAAVRAGMLQESAVVLLSCLLGRRAAATELAEAEGALPTS